VQGAQRFPNDAGERSARDVQTDPPGGVARRDQEDVCSESVDDERGVAVYMAVFGGQSASA